MMDNVLGPILLGVICCPCHQVWRAETEREKRNWQREKKQSSLQPSLLGVDQAGPISSPKFKEFPPRLFSTRASLFWNNKDKDTHAWICGAHSVPYLRPVGTHYLPRRAAPQIGLPPPCRFVTPGSDVLVGRRRSGRERRTHGVLFFAPLGLAGCICRGFMELGELLRKKTRC